MMGAVPMFYIADIFKLSKVAGRKPNNPACAYGDARASQSMKES